MDKDSNLWEKDKDRAKILKSTPSLECGKWNMQRKDRK